MRRIGIEERRARLALRHRLAAEARAATPLEAAEGVLALHASEPASVFLAIRARTAPVEVKVIEHALYEDRSLIRMHGMRRTMFVVPATLAPVVQAACTAALVAPQRRRYGKLLADAGVGDETTLADAEQAAARALAARGEATGAQLSADEPLLRTQLRLNQGKRYEQTANITSWVYRLLEDIGAEAAAAVEQAATRLTAWMHPVRVIPRFRNPLERELSVPS